MAAAKSKTTLKASEQKSGMGQMPCLRRMVMTGITQTETTAATDSGMDAKRVSGRRYYPEFLTYV